MIAPPSTSSTCADRVVVRRVRRPGRTAERRPTSSSRSASLLLCLSPRQLTRANTTTASRRRAASTSFLDRASVDLVDVRVTLPTLHCATPVAPCHGALYNATGSGGSLPPKRPTLSAPQRQISPRPAYVGQLSAGTRSGDPVYPSLSDSCGSLPRSAYNVTVSGGSLPPKHST